MPTWEIRWFWKGKIPDEVVSWSNAMNFERETSRIDTYLTFPKCSKELGIKKSRGSFEVKICKAIKPLALSNPEMNGYLELWTKCKLPLLENDTDLFAPIDGEQYSIHKTRMKRKFEVDIANESVKASSARVDDGMIVELTDLKHKGDEMWSLGIDILGSKYLDCLRIGTSQVFTEYPRKDLKKENSMSYPEWLTHL